MNTNRNHYENKGCPDQPNDCDRSKRVLSADSSNEPPGDRNRSREENHAKRYLELSGCRNVENEQDMKRRRIEHDVPDTKNNTFPETNTIRNLQNKPANNKDEDGRNVATELDLVGDSTDKLDILDSACSRHINHDRPFSFTATDNEASGNDSVASGGSAASSSSASSYVYPPAPPSTPIGPVRDSSSVSNGCNSYSFHDVATPKPSSEGTESTKATSTSQKSSPSSSGSRNKGTPKTFNVNDDFCKWKVGRRYELMRVLGRGSYGEVAQARDLDAVESECSGEKGPKYVAIKRIATAFEQEVDALRFFREIHLLRRLEGHDCIIQLLDIVLPESESVDDLNDLYLVFEYVDTDLYKLIMSPQYLTTAHIRTFLYQMLKALKFLHTSSVIHRDLKPANILLNEDCSLKICDFGLARIVNIEQVAKSRHSSSGDSSECNRSQEKPKQGLTRQLTKHVVTRWYRSPELILIQPYTTAVDIWSVGCIFAELLSMQEESVPCYEDRVPLFPGGSCFPLSGDSDSKASETERIDQLSVIIGVIGTPSDEDISSIGNATEYIKSLTKSPKKSLESTYPGADPEAIDLLKNMLQFNPSKRCTAEEALQHDFLKGVRQADIEKVCDGPLVGPAFLNSNKIHIDEIKRRTFDEVMHFKQVNNFAK